MTKKQIGLITYFLDQNDGTYIHKIYKLFYLFEALYFKEFGKRVFPNINYYVQTLSPVPDKIQKDLLSARFLKDFGYKFSLRIETPKSKKYKKDESKLFLFRPLSGIIKKITDSDDNEFLKEFTQKEIDLLREVSSKFRYKNPSGIYEHTLLKETHYKNYTDEGKFGKIIDFTTLKVKE